MKHIRNIILLFVLIAVSSTLLAVDVRTMTFAPLHKIILPKVDKMVLPDGMTIYFCEDHALPVINVRGMVRTGSVYDPADKIGLGEMTGDLIESGGAGSYSAKDLDQLLDENGIRFNSYIGQRSGGFSMSFLPEDTQLSLNVLKSAIMNPRFEEERLQIMKQGLNADIARRNDQMEDITFREFPKLVYGKDNPYARNEEYQTIANVTRDDIVKFHHDFYQPQNISISLIGDFKTADMKKTITSLFTDWKKGNTAVPPLPKVDITYKKSVNLVKKPDANQSWILMGHMAEITKDSPDYCPMVVMNNVLGGDFNSRIFQKVRTQMGLSYAPAGFYAISYDYPGLLYLMSQTKSEKTITAIRALQQVVAEMQTVPVTDQELKFAKDYYLNTYVFHFDSKGEIVGRMMELAYYNYPMDFLQTVEDGIEKVTKDDVQRVAKQYLHPNDLITLVVGNESAFEEPLTTLGT
ncbi:MAG TPA: pitrilysin family protein, partial [Candidatus Cloacimonadota bacterium]|nr:pitrilysin family protein [Candidatus Cloacimonadota bacterium]